MLSRSFPSSMYAVFRGGLFYEMVVGFHLEKSLATRITDKANAYLRPPTPGCDNFYAKFSRVAA
jgi:hypothetical protein